QPGFVDFTNPVPFLTGEFLIRWRAVAASRPRDSAHGIGVYIAYGATTDQTLSLFNLGWDPSGAFQIVTTGDPNRLFSVYAPGVADLFQLTIDMDSRTYRFAVDGKGSTSGRLRNCGLPQCKGANEGFGHTVFSAGTDFAIDDFVITKLR